MATINLDNFKIEYQYPIVHSTVENKISYRKDNMQWNNTLFTNTSWTHSTCLLSLKVRTDSWASLLALLEGNRIFLNTLITTGVAPFGDGIETNNVYLKNVSPSERIMFEWRSLQLELLRID